MKTAKVKQTEEIILVYALEEERGKVLWYENNSNRIFKAEELEFIKKK